VKIIGITVGELSGIGAEVVLKSIPYLRRMSAYRFVIFAPAQFMERYAALLHLPHPPTAHSITGDLRKVVTCEVIEPVAFRLGKTTAKTGAAAFTLVKEAIRLGLEKKIDALVTAPVCKYSINRAGIRFTGHTEMLRDMTGAEDILMFFASPHLKVGVATTHISIRKVARHLTKTVILSKLKIMHDGLTRYFAIKKPYIGVAALNPHAGEAGFIGKEEVSVIKPAIRNAQTRGLCVRGPFPADTILLQRKDYDALLFMYHDQAMIPVKLLAWGKNVNVTLGLPFVRTSPDHGTGLDIAGRGIASPSSFIAAVRLACAMVSGSTKKDNR
jgi:4-hydroxythreonine-4-phosphate dehydrogenase